MKYSIKNICLQACLLAGGALAFSSCNDFLDRKPLSQVTPEAYFTTVDHFAAYSIYYYTSQFPSHAGYGAGITNNDGGTDNMVAGDYSSRYEKGAWKVPSSSSSWSFSGIRYCNYFFETAVPKYEAGQVAGNDDEVRHYIGEMHFMRALIYYNFLKTYGDYPIITEVLPDEKEVLMEKSVRQPRNLVARFILGELDKAADLMYDKGFENNTRLNKQCALLLKSRVALYEASFEKYHAGTGRVPGDATWPGKALHPDFTLDVNAEVNFFLDEAIAAAEKVADVVTLTPNTKVADPASPDITSGWNPYFEMFASVDLSGYDEVLFWREYAKTGSYSVTHGTPAWVASGSNNGMLKGYVESFLMENGMPWYASNSEAPYKGDATIDNVKENRDNRLDLFLFSESNYVPVYSTDAPGTVKYFTPHPVSNRQEMRDMTGYRLRKYASFDMAQNVWGKAESTTGCIIYRGVEAYLNYIEAYYMKNGSISGKASQYWRAVRERAGVNPDYQKTIAATDMSKETDWGKYSGEQTVDATLLNIRRERRCEFIGEGMRWDDLVRWRSMDHMLTQKFIPEGCNFWDEIYKIADKDENGADIEFKDDGAVGANISSRAYKYLRPYSVLRDNNPVFDGYTWAKANYLSPVPIREIELLSPDENVETSVIYQNPYWPNTIGGTALE